MGDKDLYHFFESIGPVQYAIVLNKRWELKTSRYGFVTFVSVETTKLALAASTARLTLGAPWKGWSLTVGPAVQRKLPHHFHHHQQSQQEAGGRTRRVWSRTSALARGETKPGPLVKVGPASQLRVDAEAWKGRSGQQPGESELFQQHQQAAAALFFQQQQQLQYQAELHYNMMAQAAAQQTQQAYYPGQQYGQYQDTNTEQLMILPTTYYHPSGGVVWPQYPPFYTAPGYPQFDPQFDQQTQVQPQEFGQQYLPQCQAMQDSGYGDLTNASIVTADLSQSGTYESKEMPASPVLNLSQVLNNHEDAKRVGPYKRFKTFNGENLLKTRGVGRDSSKGERGRVFTQPGKDSIIAKEPTNTNTVASITIKGKEKEMKKGIKKKIVHALPEAEILPEPFKQMSIK